MGTLRDPKTDTTYPLRANHLVGRSRDCALQIERDMVSSTHAAICYARGVWYVRDLGSKNGTYMDGKPVGTDWVVLRRGAALGFGRRDADLVFDEDAPPGPTLEGLDGAPRLELADPAGGVGLRQEGDGTWLLETESGAEPVANEQIVEIAGARYRVSLPDAVAPTTDLETEVRDACVVLAVSRDEEHVEARLERGGQRRELGSHAHFYLLLTLARLREADVKAGLAEETCGWVYQDDLVHKLRVTPPQLNLHVFRLRRQFDALLPGGGTYVIERRPRTHQLRTGLSRFRFETL